MRMYWFFIWTNLNPLHLRMHCAKLGWNWPSGSGEEDFFFLIFVNIFWLLFNYLLLERGGAVHLNTLESPLPKDALGQVWLKMDQWFWRRRWKCGKVTTTPTTTTDKFWSEKLTWAFGSGGSINVLRFYPSSNVCHHKFSDFFLENNL